MESFCRKLDVVLDVARANECESSIVGRRDAEDGTVIDHAEHARAVRRRQCLRVLAVLRLRLIRLWQALARRLKANLVRIRCDIVRAVMRDLASLNLEERKLSTRQTCDALDARYAMVAHVARPGARTIEIRRIVRVDIRLRRHRRRERDQAAVVVTVVACHIARDDWRAVDVRHDSVLVAAQIVARRVVRIDMFAIGQLCIDVRIYRIGDVCERVTRTGDEERDILRVDLHIGFATRDRVVKRFHELTIAHLFDVCTEMVGIDVVCLSLIIEISSTIVAIVEDEPRREVAIDKTLDLRSRLLDRAVLRLDVFRIEHQRCLIQIDMARIAKLQLVVAICRRHTSRDNCIAVTIDIVRIFLAILGDKGIRRIR